MTIACRGLKVEVKVKAIGQANAVDPASIEASLFSSFQLRPISAW